MTAVATLPVVGHGPLTVYGSHWDDDDRVGLVTVRMQSLRRVDGSWLLDLYPKEAAKLMAALATALAEAVGGTT